MQKLKLAAVLLIYSFSALAEQAAIDEAYIKNNFTSVDRFGSTYQQTVFSLTDYEADKTLLERTIRTKKAALSLLGGNSPIKSPSRANESVYETMKQDHKNQSVNLEGMTNPINLQGFIKMLNQVLLEESQSYKIEVGEFHKWHPQLKKEHPLSLFLKFPKPLIALAQGDTSKFLYTGSEEKLILWILEQPAESITPEMMFRKSLQLNSGNVYLTILSIENILSKFWFTADRENTRINRRLKPFHNQLGSAGDKFGFWYHFFGLILQSYCYGKQSALFAFQIESLISDILAKEPDYQEDYSGHYASLIGAELRKSVERHSYKSVISNPDSLKFENYTNLNEDYFLRLPYEVDKNLSISLAQEKSTVKLNISHSTKNLDGCILKLWFKGPHGHPDYSQVRTYKIKLNQSNFYQVSYDIPLQKQVKGNIRCIDQADITFERKL